MKMRKNVLPFCHPVSISSLLYPSLLPKYGGLGMYGRRVHEAVVAANETVSGCTIHLVTENYDEGPILAQAEVPVGANDTAEVLAGRVFEAECQLLPNTLVALASGQISLTDALRGIR